MLNEILTHHALEALRVLYGQEAAGDDLQIQKTRKEFEGDLTLVVFPYTRLSRKSPEDTGRQMGDYLLEHAGVFCRYNVVKGFLNLVVQDSWWLEYLEQNGGEYRPSGDIEPSRILIEFSSPNTNKPLHLGHIRNNLLGWSVSRILEAAGHEVYRVNLVNDRGIHICKSMLAWKRWGQGLTPEQCGKKGDHLVGDFYVLFDRHYKEEIATLVAEGMNEEEAARQAPLIQEAQAMLKAWEEGDEEVRNLWQMMNAWVYSGFEETYKRLGISFHKTYYESDTYLYGKELVGEGLKRGLLFQKEDGSVWIDLTDEGLDEKLLLRADGTSVYMTQDLGTAELRYAGYHPDRMVYVVGNEQNYHFDVLKKVLKRLEKNSATAIYHLSYGMVELPHGKMKSREGTVVDADALMDEMETTAREMTESLGKTAGSGAEEAQLLYRTVGLGALKYFILKVDPEKNMLFNPVESVDFDGNTGPFIQYTHARISSLMRKAEGIRVERKKEAVTMLPEEREVLILCHDADAVLKKAAAGMSPAHIANYLYELARAYNTFYQKIPVLKEEDADLRSFRLELSALCGRILKYYLDLLGIEAPERM